MLAIPQAVAAGAIIVLGDSLSAGYGIRPDQAWPALLDHRLAERHADYSVANLSISGETTAGGRSRLEPALRKYRPAILILALGANDGLRGLPLSQMQANLEGMIDTAQRQGTRVLLAGMRLPPNYGPYADDFAAVFKRIAQKKKAALLPFLLEPVARQPTLFQDDQLHPTAEAQALILDHLWPVLRPLLK